MFDLPISDFIMPDFLTPVRAPTPLSHQEVLTPSVMKEALDAHLLTTLDLHDHLL